MKAENPEAYTKPSPTSVTEATSANFKKEVLQSKQKVLVDFNADWCGPCKMLAPELEKLADAYDGKVKVAKINVDHERELAASFHVSSIPALFILKDGVVVAETFRLSYYYSFCSLALVSNVVDKQREFKLEGILQFLVPLLFILNMLRANMYFDLF